MKQKLLKSMLLLCILVGGVCNAWGEVKTSTLTFEAKCNGSGTADDDVKWTVTSDGSESTFDNTKGIHYGTSSGKVKYITLSTSDISGTITKVVVNASTASGVSATASVTVGGDAFGGDAQSLASSAADYTFTGSASGEIIVTVTKPSNATKAIYVKSIAVTYTTGGSLTPSISANNVNIAYDATNGSIAYTLANATGNVGAEVTTGDWLTLGTVTASEVPFTCSANTEATARTATVTLSFEGATNKVVTVTQGVNPIYGSSTNPYTVAQAMAVVDAAGKTAVSDKYVTGIVSQVDGYNSTYNSITYWISDDGTTTNQFEVFGGLSFDGGTAFSSKDDIQVGDVVVVKGNITYYSSGKIYEFQSNSHLVSLNLVAPTFSPAAGAVTSGTEVAISDAHTNATIYYTTDDSDPTTSSEEYAAPIEITTATTIKAIAVIDGYATSDVATAVYTINVTPSITVDATDPIEVSAAENDGELALTYANLTINATDVFDVQFYDENGDEISDPDWIDVAVEDATPSGYKVSYTVGANTGEARSANFKVYALDDNTNSVYSNKVTITQAKFVASKTYSLASGITSGKHYIITNGSNAVMGYDKGNNRDAVAITINEGVATVAADNTNVYEFVIYGPDANGYYTIYDALDKDNNQNIVGGYLYAASSSSNNLKTRETNSDLNGKWTIVFNNDNQAVITAQGTNTHNLMRYNSSSVVFSCYVSGQQPIYLFEKDNEDTPTESVTVGETGYTTYTTTNAVSLPDDVTAYIVTAANGSYASLKSVKSIPASTSVIINASEGTYDLESIGSPESVSDNLLLVSDGKVKGGTGIYALANKNHGVGFYLVNSSVTIPNGKAYLQTTANTKEFLNFDFSDDETGINTVNGSELMVNSPIYNLSGQRMSKLQKGINIVNGKKVLF